MTNKTQKFIDKLVEELKKEFKQRLKLVVLVGSVARGEENENSDIDLNVILDKVSFEDVLRYKEIVAETEDGDKPCGYLGGEDEIKVWPKYDLTAFFLGSVVLHGNLYEVIPKVTESDIKENAVIMLSGINHAARHSVIYDESEYAAEMAYGLYKSAFFVIQYKYYLVSGSYIAKRNDLEVVCGEKDALILQMYEKWNTMKNDRINNPEDVLKLIERWSSETLLNEIFKN